MWGWNTMKVDGAWVPTFPNARYLVHRDEWAYWATEQSGEAPQIMADSVRPILAAGLMDQVASRPRGVRRGAASSPRPATRRAMCRCASGRRASRP